MAPRNLANRKNEHIMMCCGTPVRICNGEVNVLGVPKVRYCPLLDKLYGIKRVTRDVVKQIVEMKIRKFGLFTPHRTFEKKLWVPYGASEMIKIGLEKKLFDCAVIVSEGAGTVITTNGDLVQSIGARLNGIIKTSPIPGIIEYIEENSGVILDKNTAKIDQVEGVLEALKRGHRRIAVTIAGFRAWEISKIREIEENHKAEITVFSICNTVVSEEMIKHIAKADLIWSSASKIIRERIGKKALIQLGVGIPVFALTPRSKRIILQYLEDFKNQLIVFRTRLPYIVKEREPKTTI
ncbi:MAG: methanogenesis marker 8 protein [Candidatus Njordarchaeales archaeon]